MGIARAVFLQKYLIFYFCAYVCIASYSHTVYTYIYIARLKSPNIGAKWIFSKILIFFWFLKAGMIYDLESWAVLAQKWYFWGLTEIKTD